MKPAQVSVAKHRPRRNWETFGLLAVLIVGLLAAVLWTRIVITVPAGHVGVLWLRFFGGTVRDTHYDEGTTFIFPWDRVYLYDARLQRVDQEVAALTIDGLRVTMSVSVTYFLNRDRIGELHAAVGEDYQKTLVIPVVVSQVVLFMAGRRAYDIYSMGRSQMVHEIIDGIDGKLGGMFTAVPGMPTLVQIVDLNIREIELPRAVEASIEEKHSAEQNVLTHRYLVDQEALESQRRIIAAEGTRRIQEIVSPGLTDPFIRWQYLDVLHSLAAQPNNKIVVLGPGANGSGLVLNPGGDIAAAKPADGK